jgi:hypothetical protein
MMGIFTLKILNVRTKKTTESNQTVTFGSFVLAKLSRRPQLKICIGIIGFLNKSHASWVGLKRSRNLSMKLLL